MAYAIQKKIVARSFNHLREQGTHTLFAGYLHLQQRAGQLGRLEDLEPDFLSFFQRFFLVGNHPLGTPYIKPFTDQKPSKRNLWLNENVAGSYAPSSLRPDQPFRQVVEISGKKYSLRPDHARLARKHLLSTKVPAAELAVFLYRDFGLLCDTPTIKDLIDIFAFEFGYASKSGARTDETFDILYSLESVKHWDTDWLEWHE